MKAPASSKPIVRKLRCAVYTRKSSEEGLDMEFNSLDAQREACAAYVASQKVAALVTGAFFVRNAFIVISVALFGLGVFALTSVLIAR